MDNPEDKPQKKHTCTQCGKKFTWPAHLREHIHRVHEGVHYQCAQCHKHFSTESYRNQHQRQCQGEAFTCSDCGQEFGRILELQTHRRNVHPRLGPSGIKRKQLTPSPLTSEDTGARSMKRLKQLRSEPVHHNVDPFEPEEAMIPGGGDELSAAMREVYQEHWLSIRTHHHTTSVDHETLSGFFHTHCSMRKRVLYGKQPIWIHS